MTHLEHGNTRCAFNQQTVVGDIVPSVYRAVEQKRAVSYASRVTRFWSIGLSGDVEPTNDGYDGRQISGVARGYVCRPGSDAEEQVRTGKTPIHWVRLPSVSYPKDHPHRNSIRNSCRRDSGRIWPQFALPGPVRP